MRFIIIYSHGPNWREGIVLYNQPTMPKHAVYVQQNQQHIMLAGPFEDGSGGALVVDVEDQDEARKIAENDPAVLSGVFNYEIKAWNTIFSKYEGNKKNFDQKYLEFKHKIQKELGII